MQPINLLDNDAIAVWGNDQVDVLCDYYGSEQQHKTSNETITSGPMIDKENTKAEWQKVKLLVKQQSYPTHGLHSLWNIIALHHREEFPNLVSLVMLALVHPVHTADCEQSFSSQNLIT